MPHIPALLYFDNSAIYPQWFHRVKFVVISSRFVERQSLWNIAILRAVGCHNSWAHLQCSYCLPLGEKLLWNRSIKHPWKYNTCIFVFKCCFFKWLFLLFHVHGHRATCPSDHLSIHFKWHYHCNSSKISDMSHMGWCTVSWSRHLLKMAILGWFLMVHIILTFSMAQFNVLGNKVTTFNSLRQSNAYMRL